MNLTFGCLRKQGNMMKNFKNADELIKAENNDDIQKSDIFTAIDGYNSKITVKKTGKEIKRQVNEVLLPELTAELAVKKAEANAELERCGTAPTHDIPYYWMHDLKLDCGYKFYEWDETYIPNKADARWGIYESLSAPDAIERRGNAPEDAAQAEARRKYNDLVHAICEITIDIKACEVLKDISDTASYDLTASQIISLKFS